VAFTDPYIKDVHEIIVTSKDVKGLRNKRDLSNRTVHVVSGSSYVEHLKELNKQFIQEGLKPIKIVKTDEFMESEDLLQMVNAGIFKLMVVDQHIAELWSQVLANIVLRKDLFIHSGGEIAWAVRKNNPKLLEVLNTFARKHRQGTLLGNILLKRYYKNSNWIQNPLTKEEEKKFEKLSNLFQKYAEMYQFDWLKIAALAFQESRLIQNKKSREGAVGIMQIKPATARDKNINIKDVYKMENNIHAGVKYLAFLRDRYFDKPHIDPNSRVDFTFAAYNAGPARVNSLRREAEKMGLDPDKWFFNVEYAARKKIGLETVQYVANVNKYYVAYKSMNNVQEEKTKKIEKLIESQ
jgi:membrane-bound lytic murein transglycosylase MltF